LSRGILELWCSGGVYVRSLGQSDIQEKST
jgi:hypothetical protein